MPTRIVVGVWKNVTVMKHSFGQESVYSEFYSCLPLHVGSLVLFFLPFLQVAGDVLCMEYTIYCAWNRLEFVFLFLGF